MPKPELEFTPTSTFPSTATPDVIAQTLSSDPDTGDNTVLLTHTAGSEWGDPVCTHEYWEEVYIISGRLFDKGLGKWFGEGDYCCRPPGMLHGPFKADGEVGCKEICWLRFPRVDERVAKN